MPLLIVRTLGELVAFTLCAFVVGSGLVALVRRLAHATAHEEPGLRECAVRVLAGFGGIGYVAVALALLHALRWWVLVVLGAAVLAAGHRQLLLYARVAHRSRPRNRVALAGAGVAVAMACGQLLAALAPPEAYDELAYHLPIARAIDSTHAAQQLLHAHDAYGNLPSLGESLYAAALAVDGTALVHALQFTVVLAFVVLAAAFVRELCGARAGVVTAIALLAYPHLTYLGTTGYVDAAATAFEVGALLLVLRWIMRSSPADLPAGALLLGFAVSVKYTALFTAGVIGVAVAVVAIRRAAARPALTSAGIALAAGGFWYAKNLIRFGNPFWPFYLGHRSMDDRTYTDFVASIHAFGPRTLNAFLEVPWRLAADSGVVPFVALSIVVLAIAVRPARLPALYALAFTAYWFWIASHQVRFLLSGVVVAIVAVVLATAAGGRAERAALALAAVAAIVVVQIKLHPFSASAAGGAVLTQLGSPKADYALGLESRTTYLRKYAGCQADAVSYLDAHPSLSPVLVRQTALAPWFARRTIFGKLPAGAGDPARALRSLRAGGFHAALVRKGEPASFASNDLASAAVRGRLHAIWRGGGCTIFRVR
jgi:4-amino-4-deoxy-L-arabinose transferase-like glycosyltransferase